jgi:hypothetical protein
MRNFSAAVTQMSSPENTRLGKNGSTQGLPNPMELDDSARATCRSACNCSSRWADSFLGNRIIINSKHVNLFLHIKWILFFFFYADIDLQINDLIHIFYPDIRGA